MTDDDKTCKSMVREMLAADIAWFTGWEIGFLESVDRQPILSEKQKDTIEKIYKKRMP
jgi:hypothetical protein